MRWEADELPEDALPDFRIGDWVMAEIELNSQPTRGVIISASDSKNDRSSEWLVQFDLHPGEEIPPTDYEEVDAIWFYEYELSLDNEFGQRRLV